MLPSIAMVPGRQVIWFDSPVYQVKTPWFFDRNKKFILANTQWTASVIQRSFGKTPDVIPYPVVVPDNVKPLPFAERDGFVSIGTNRLFDRKNMGLLHSTFYRMQMRKYLTIVSNETFSDIRTEYSLTDKWNLLRKAKFYLALSRAEGQGLPPLEAMAVGTPVIYIDAHTFHELYPEGVGIKIKPSFYEDVIHNFVGSIAIFRLYQVEEKDLVEAINYAIGIKKEEYENMSQKAIEFVKSKFSLEVVLDKLNDYLYAVFQKSIELKDGPKGGPITL